MININPAAPLLEVDGLVKHYVDARGVKVRAVDSVSFTLHTGEVLGIVGESGCGKTTLGRTLMRLMEPTSGAIRINGEDFIAKRGAALKAARRNLQMVFQDPFGSLNPRHSIGAIIGEPLHVHGVPDAAARVAALLELVGLPSDAATRYPHEFSGGQRQRIAIARALALKPKLIIADEPVSALDVSIQSQILNLISDLRARFGLSMIFISHDLSVIRHVSDRIAVMYFGKIVEIGTAQEIIENPLHPYTQALVAAIPKPPGSTLANSNRNHPPSFIPQTLRGEVPDPANPPPGCAFKARCKQAMDSCAVSVPPLKSVTSPDVSNRLAACIRL
jgi:oligopeptide/dipeptide ABC transporter ATP-binding protein